MSQLAPQQGAGGSEEQQQLQTDLQTALRRQEEGALPVASEMLRWPPGLPLGLSETLSLLALLNSLQILETFKYPISS